MWACDSVDTANETKNRPSEVPYAIAIHGGAGTILKANMTAEMEAAYTQILDSVLTTGEKMLEADADAVQVVIEVIKIMENSPLFNAGKGAVFNTKGENASRGSRIPEYVVPVPLSPGNFVGAMARHRV